MLRTFTFILAAIAMACGEPAEPPPGGSDAGSDAGPAETWDDLAPMLEPLRDRHGLPGMAGAVLRDGEVIALGSVGLRKLGDSTPVQDSDLWHLGSCTKAMTATLLGTFVEEGSLDWDTTLAEAFPHLAATMDPGYVDVTLAQLLAHFGGAWSSIADHPAVANVLGTDQRPVMELRAWFVEQLLSQPPENTPGSTFAYSNSGYITVGAAMELVAGVEWEALMRARLFEPLGMSSCGFGPPGISTSVEQPWGHLGTDVASLEPAFLDNPPMLGPAGTVHCSMVDWAKFLAVHIEGDSGDTALLTQASFATLHTVWATDDYALGWAVVDRPWAEGVAYTHSGSNNMWFVTAWLAPNKDIAVFGATNAAVAPNAPTALDQAFGELLTAYLQ